MQNTTRQAQKFKLLADALNANGGYDPIVNYVMDSTGIYKPSSLASQCNLVPYPRESAQKYASRASGVFYENHLKSACERFVGYITRRPPVRDGLKNPLAMAIVHDADWSNNHIDVFWNSFMVNAKARGTMLLLIEQPAAQAQTQAEAIDRRLVPYLTAIEPERVTDYELDERKRLAWIKINAIEKINGEYKNVERYWDAAEWRVYDQDRIIAQGQHPFGECPMLIFTESGQYPHIGNYSQIADISKRIYNARSELDEILRSQTFSVMTYQVTPEMRNSFASVASEVSSTIGTSNMLLYEGQTPSFIAPPDGPASIYLQVIENLQQTIKDISYAIDNNAKAAETATAIAIRFQSLNSALSVFATRMQDLESRAWQIIGRFLGLQNPVKCQWASDYSIADMERELNIIATMQATGFSPLALAEQRKRIASQLFETQDDNQIAQIMASLDETAQEVQTNEQMPVP